MTTRKSAAGKIVATWCLISLCSVTAEPAAAQQPSHAKTSQWSTELTVQRAPVSHNGVDQTWATESVQTTWVRPEKAGWTLVVLRQQRYGAVDGTAFTQGYVRTQNWTMLAAVGATPGASFMYRFTTTSEISRRVFATGVGSIGYRYFQFPGVRVQQLQPGFTWYHAAGELHSSVFVTRNGTVDRTTATALFRAAHDVTSYLRIGGGFAYGDRIFDIAALGSPSARSRMAFGEGRAAITARDFLLIGISIAHEDPAFAYRSFSIGYRRSF